VSVKIKCRYCEKLCGFIGSPTLSGLVFTCASCYIKRNKEGEK